MTIRQIFVLMLAVALLLTWATWVGLFTDYAFDFYGEVWRVAFRASMFEVDRPAKPGPPDGWAIPWLIGAMARIVMEAIKWVGLPIAILVGSIRAWSRSK